MVRRSKGRGGWGRRARRRGVGARRSRRRGWHPPHPAVATPTTHPVRLRALPLPCCLRAGPLLLASRPPATCEQALRAVRRGGRGRGASSPRGRHGVRAGVGERGMRAPSRQGGVSSVEKVQSARSGAPACASVGALARFFFLSLLFCPLFSLLFSRWRLHYLCFFSP